MLTPEPCMTIANSDKFIDIPTNKCTEKPTEKCIDMPTNKCMEMPINKCTEMRTIKFTNLPTAKCTEKPTEMSTVIRTNNHSLPVSATLRQKPNSNIVVESKNVSRMNTFKDKLTKRCTETPIDKFTDLPTKESSQMLTKNRFSDQFGSNAVHDRQKPEQVDQPSPTEKTNCKTPSKKHFYIVQQDKKKILREIICYRQISLLLYFHTF